MKSQAPSMPESTKTAHIAGGCFWCLEAVFSHTKGVLSVTSGYAGGNKINPTYEEVGTGKTGHTETVKIEYDPKIINYEDILHIFFSIHDPTTPNRQGNDIGTQYRSIIFYTNEKQKEISEQVMKELSDQNIYSSPIVTELIPLNEFYPAESYHQKYFENHPEAMYCQIVINPKIAKFREKYKSYYK